MNKITLQTTDMVDENIRRIGEMFPICLTEVKDENGRPQMAIDFDQLRQELSKDIVEGPVERYQFTWPDKRNAIRLANAPTTDTLRPVRNDETTPTGADSEGNPYCSTGSVNFDTTENLYIEGDNLQVLKLLREDYLGKIKMIYIDPPYNTGNDFVYDDDFSQSSDEYVHNSGQTDENGNRLVANTESNGRFHTDWLNMIYPRLKVAKDLLSEDGILFISIDDNEITNLKKICDEIFGAANFKSQSIVINNRGGRDYGGIALQHDYILIYTRSNLGSLNLIEEKDKEFQYKDEFGGFNLMELRNRNVKFNDKNRPNLCYPFYVNPNSKDSNGLLEIALEPKPGFVEVYPAKSNGIQTVWRWGKEEKARKNLNIEIFGKVNQNGGYMIVQKYRKTTKMQRSVWDEKEFVNERGTEAVKELFNNKAYFDYPKSIFTIKRVIELGCNKDCLILDFFSGSGTTAHAVMELNAEDKGRRKFIMVQLPEPTTGLAKEDGYNTLCDIAKERIRRAGKKIKEEHPEAKDLDIGFRVLKLDTSNMEDVQRTPKQYTQASLFADNLKPGRTEEDLLFQTMLRLGIDLSAKIETFNSHGKKVFNVNDNYLLACFDTDVNESAIEEIAKRQPIYFVMRDASLASDNVRDNIDQLWKHYNPGREKDLIII